MDGELILIFGFILTLTVLILTFGTIAGNRSRAHKLQRLEIEARIEEARAAQAGQRTGNATRLEERVRVLERIATDREPDLAAQIEQLRDVQEADRLVNEKEIVQ